MRLLVEFDYFKVLFGKNAPIAEIISAFDGIKNVEQKGYGETTTYEIKKDTNISIKLINDDAVCLPDGESNDYEAFHNLAQKRDELQKRVYELENKLKEIGKTVGGNKC